MDKETSGSEEWLETIKTSTENLGLSDALNTVARHMKDEFGIRLWFVEILGPRWSYIAGSTPEQPPETPMHHIRLDENIGLVSDSWEQLPHGHRTRLVEFLNRLVTKKAVSAQK